MLRLEVESANGRAREFYRKVGFQEHDRRLMTKWIRMAEGGAQAGDSEAEREMPFRPRDTQKTPGSSPGVF